jgi:protein O-GlcNAc transferase
MGRLQEAAEIYQELLNFLPHHTVILNNLATVFFQLGDLDAGLILIQQSLNIDPKQPFAEYNKGKALQALNKTSEAIESFECAIALKPDLIDAHNDKGMILQSLERHREAIDSFDRALALDSKNHKVLNNRGCSLKSLNSLKEALADLDRAVQLQPAVPEIQKNRGDILEELTQYESAINCYDLAIRNRPDYAEAYNNKGLALKGLNRLDEALENYDRAIALKAIYPEAHFNRGWILGQQRKYPEALESYQRAIDEKRDIDYGLGTVLTLKMRLFDWQGLDEMVAEIVDRIAMGQRSATPFSVLAFSDSLEIQRKAAKIWIDDRHPIRKEEKSPRPFNRSRKKRLAIGYYSADFRMHPVSYLTAGVYEQHDRSRFEIYAFSNGPDTPDSMHQRLAHAFDHFIDIRKMSDLETVNLSRELGIDIAVDLGGLTQDCRPGIFSLRAAPIQVNYLGYPGSMGSAFMDYILGDAFLIPDLDRDSYSEKVVQLPVFQANDHRRVISNRVFARTELGIPGDAFAFCCLNSSQKINPEVFSGWMNILDQVPSGILALLSEDVRAEDRLRQEASKRGVDPKRLIFLGRVNYEDYLARYRSFDLLLDTFPFNAGTTASDALWAGLPILTRAGNSYVSRMAGSLLQAMNLPELVTETPSEFEAAAIKLATQPLQLANIREKLTAARSTGLLFNTAAFTRSLEQGYELMHRRLIDGLLPEHLTVT